MPRPDDPTGTREFIEDFDAGRFEVKNRSLLREVGAGGRRPSPDRARTLSLQDDPEEVLGALLWLENEYTLAAQAVQGLDQTGPGFYGSVLNRLLEEMRRATPDTKKLYAQYITRLDFALQKQAADLLAAERARAPQNEDPEAYAMDRLAESAEFRSLKTIVQLKDVLYLADWDEAFHELGEATYNREGVDRIPGYARTMEQILREGMNDHLRRRGLNDLRALTPYEQQVYVPALQKSGFLKNTPASDLYEDYDALMKDTDSASDSFAAMRDSLQALMKQDPDRLLTEDYQALLSSARKAAEDYRDSHNRSHIFSSGTRRFELSARLCEKLTALEQERQAALDAALNTRELSDTHEPYDTVFYHLTRDAVAAGLSREVFTEAVAAAPRRTGTDLQAALHAAHAEDPDTEEVRLTPLKPEEAARREALSRKAMRRMARMEYDNRTTREPLKSHFTREEWTRLETSRDNLTVILDMGSDPFTVEDNLDSLNTLLGKNLRDDDPKRAEKHQKAVAQLLNARMRKIASFNYGKYINLTDEELVDKWPEMYESFYRLSISRAELSEFKPEDNPYVDSELVKRCLEKEAVYTTYHYYNQQRMRLISSPYYAKADTRELLELPSRNRGILGSVNTDEDHQLNRFISFVQDTVDARSTALQEHIVATVARVHSLPQLKDVKLFAADGSRLREPVYDVMSRGGLVYAVGESDETSLMAFSMDSASGELLEAQVPRGPEAEAARERIVRAVRDKQKELYAKSTSQKLEIYIDRTMGSYVGISRDMADEVLEKDLDPAYLKAVLTDTFLEAPALKARDFFRLAGATEPGYTELPEETAERKKLLALLAEKAPENASEKEKLAFAQENRSRVKAFCQERAKISVAAHLALFDTSLAISQSMKPVQLPAHSHWTPRFFKYFLFKPGKNNLEYNRKLVNRYFNGGPAERSKVVEEALNAFLEKAPLFEKRYSDRELVEHWHELGPMGVAMGMEFDSAMKGFQKDGVVIAPELLKKINRLHEKVYGYNNYYMHRMNLIGSPLYQYCLPDNETLAASLMSQKDPALSQLGVETLNAAMSAGLTYGEFAHCSVFPEGAAALEGVFTEKGEFFPASDEAGYGAHIRQGETLFFVAKNSMELKAVRITPGGYPPAMETVQPALSPKAVQDMIYDCKLRSIERREDLSPAAKLLHIAILTDLRELDRLCDAPEQSRDREAQRQRLGSLMARLTLRNAFSGGVPDEDIRGLTAPENIAQFSATLVQSGLAEQVLGRLTSDPVQRKKLTPDNIYGLMISSQAELTRARSKQRQEAPREPVQKAPVQKVAVARVPVVKVPVQKAKGGPGPGKG